MNVNWDPDLPVLQATRADHWVYFQFLLKNIYM